MDWLKRNWALMLIVLHLPLIIIGKFLIVHPWFVYSWPYVMYFVGVVVGMALYKFLKDKGVFK